MVGFTMTLKSSTNLSLSFTESSMTVQNVNGLIATSQKASTGQALPYSVSLKSMMNEQLK